MKHNALLLTGGGARAAYQIGVIKAIHDYHYNTLKYKGSLFDIFCGVSAGAINSVAMASNNDNPMKAIDNLYQFWSTMKVEQIYETDNISIFKTALPWLKKLLPIPFVSKQISNDPVFFLNNRPLSTLLSFINFDKIQTLIEKEQLHGCSVTCSSYHSGQTIAFFEANQQIQEWDKLRRIGINHKLTISHLLASSAIPMIFPAQSIKGEWFGDGSMREQAPLSPAIQLGANKIFVIGTGKVLKNESQSLISNDVSLVHTQKPYPTVAQIGGHVLNGLFLDNIQADVDRLLRTNDILKMFNQNDSTTIGLRNIDLFMCNPSKKIDEVASQHVHRLPKSILKLLERIGATEKLGGSLASYLLFEENYCNDLITIGYEDAWNQKIKIAEFLNLV